MFPKCEALGEGAPRGAMSDDLDERGRGALQLVVGVEEVRPEAEADVRPDVEQNLARLQLGVHGLEVWNADDDRATATLRRPRADDLEAGVVEEPDEMRRLAHRVLPDPLDADLLDDLVAGRRRVQRGHVRRPGQETGGALRVLQLRREVEWSRVGLPADERRLEPFGEIGTDVEPGGAGTATKPFDAPADGEVDVQRGHIQRNGANGLVRVEDHVQRRPRARAR